MKYVPWKTVSNIFLPVLVAWWRVLAMPKRLGVQCLPPLMLYTSSWTMLRILAWVLDSLSCISISCLSFGSVSSHCCIFPSINVKNRTVTSTISCISGSDILTDQWTNRLSMEGMISPTAGLVIKCLLLQFNDHLIILPLGFIIIPDKIHPFYSLTLDAFIHMNQHSGDGQRGTDGLSIK